MKTLAVCSLLCLGSCMSTATSGEQGASNEFTSAYVQALEASDLETLTSFYAEDVRWYVDGRLHSSGSNEMRDAHEYAAELGTELDFGEVETEGEHARMSVEERNELFGLLGVDSVGQTIEFTRVDGRVVQVRSTYDREDVQALGVTLPVFFLSLIHI